MKVIKNRNIYIGISGFILVLSLFFILFGNLKLGIDMTGGMQVDYDYKNNIDITKIQKELSLESKKILNDGKETINDVSAYKVTGEKTMAVVIGFYNNIEEKKLNELKNTFKMKILEVLKKEDSTVIESRYINIGKSFGDYIKNTAILTLILAVIAIAIYVTYAFSGIINGISLWSFAIITILTLCHDIILSTGAYILTSGFFPEFKIDIFFITALLTILGYSINDTIVVFDRIRGNLKAFGGRSDKKGKNLEQIIDSSINETLTRSIYTSLTLMFVLITIFLFGPESIKGFILTMIFGTFFGTYSSIFIAAPILYIVNKNKKLTIYKRVEKNQDDKIVV